MSTIGTKDHPVGCADMASLVQAWEQTLRAPNGGRGVWMFQGEFLVWRAGRWEVFTQEKMERAAWMWLKDVWVGGQKIQQIKVTTSMCQEVVFGLGALVEAPWKRLPVWTDGGRGDPGWCIPFEDVVVSVEGGEIRTWERDEKWLDPMVLRARWEPGAERTRWEQALGEWSKGDEEWKRLLKRWFGYVLMSQREYRKWLLMYGLTAGGKGTICHVLREAMGTTAFVTVDMETLAGEFGLGGLGYARVMNIDEVSDLTKGGGARVGRVVKNLVGQDPLVINEKYRAVLKDQRSNAAVMMSSNQIPKLPNEGGGLSEKMLTLPIRVSFDKRGAEVGLKDRLVREEMAGILAWAVEGALELAREKGQEERWPVPEGSGDVQRTYRAMSNPLGAFLESRFVQVEDGWVPGRLIRLEWGRFLRETHTKGVHIPKNQLLLRMEKEGGWQVERKKRRDGGTGEIVMGLCGLALKKAIEEDL